MKHVGIDVGRDRVKVVADGKKVAFKSRVGEWRERKLTTGGDYDVEVNGQKYFISDLAEESYFIREMATSSKIHDETKILFLSALVLVSEPNDKLAITTSLPVDQHTPEEKEQLSALLKGCHTIKVNDKRGIFDVNQLGIVPESGGVYWDMVLGVDGSVRNPFLASQTVRVIDVGSRTVNYCTIKQRKYLDRDSGTLNYGVMELRNATLEPTPEACEQFTRRIVADLSKKWLNYDPSRDIILLSGGGSLLLEKWLSRHFKLAQMAEDPLYGNASGSYKMGVARWREN